jgi:ATP-dependent Clp protease ATP-binding subunit ClpA
MEAQAPPLTEKIPMRGDPMLSNLSKRVLANMAEEAGTPGHSHIVPEHLLGLLREGERFAAKLLREQGADLDRARKQLGTQPDSHRGGKRSPE